MKKLDIRKITLSQFGLFTFFTFFFMTVLAALGIIFIIMGPHSSNRTMTGGGILALIMSGGLLLNYVLSLINEKRAQAGAQG